VASAARSALTPVSHPRRRRKRVGLGAAGLQRLGAQPTRIS
jgi:hypothetical protein